MPEKEVLLIGRMDTNTQDLGMKDPDLRLLVNAEYTKRGAVQKVKGYTQVGDILNSIISQRFDSTTDWDSGSKTSTTANDGDLTLSGLTISQTEYNDFHTVYGSNWFAQSFTATSTVVNKIRLYLQKSLGSSLQLYDDFGDSSFDTSKWNQSGSDNDIEETGGKLHLYGYRTSGNNTQTTVIDTNGKTGTNPPGEPITGAKFDMSINRNPGEAGSPQYWCELNDGAGNVIRIQKTNGTNETSMSASGIYGPGTSTELKRMAGNGGTFEIVQDGSDLKLYLNSVLQYTFSGVSVAADTYFLARANGSAITDSDIYLILDNVYFYTDVTAIADLDVRIETDSSGPSGSLVTNGETSIEDVDVSSSSVTSAEAVFATPPATSVGTKYWIVMKQAGGDASNNYRVYKNNTSLYNNGQAYASTNSGTAWSADSDGDTDAAFILYGSPITSGTWTSPNIILSAGQTLSQIQLFYRDVSPSNYIDRVDILNTSDVVQSSYTTNITSGTLKTLYSTDFNFGFGYTLSNTFRVKITLVSAGTISPVIDKLILDNPTNEIIELSPFYQSSGTKALMAIIAGVLKRLVSSVWTTIYSDLTAGLPTSTTIFRASKGPRVASGTVGAFTSTSITAAVTPEPGPNDLQGKMIKIVSGPGVGQVRVIQSNTGTSTSTTTTTTTTTTTSTSTTAT